MRRSEEVERLAKEKEIWNKEKDLSKEEEVASWTRTIEALEKVYKGFYSYKDFRSGKFKPEPVWTCEGKYKDEDKAACKKEVMRILKQCKKEDVLINIPAVVNVMYINRLRKREVMKEDNEMEETLPEERLPQAKETMRESSDINATGSIVSEGKEDEDIDKEWSEHAIERWGKFLRSLEDKDNVDCCRKWLEMVKGRTPNETINIDAKDLVKREYEQWIEDEDKKLCWLEVVKILKVCNEEELINSNPYVVQQLYIDRLIRNGFVEEVEKEEELVTSGKQITDDDTTMVQTNGCDGMNLTSSKDTLSRGDNRAKCLSRIRAEREKLKKKK